MVHLLTQPLPKLYDVELRINAIGNTLAFDRILQNTRSMTWVEKSQWRMPEVKKGIQEGENYLTVYQRNVKMEGRINMPEKLEGPTLGFGYFDTINTIEPLVSTQNVEMHAEFQFRSSAFLHGGSGYYLQDIWM